MKKIRFLNISILFLIMVCQGCASVCVKKDTISQFSTINALSEGLYETDFDFAQIKKYGNFGIGTFNNLDGEMVASGGKFYQASFDGSVRLVKDSDKSAFCVVKFFKPDRKIYLKGKNNCKYITEQLDSVLTSKNIFCAVKIEGKFNYIKARSVPKQEKPYKKLYEATKAQSVFEFKDLDAILVGFRFPEYMSELNVGTWHFHFISKDGKLAGHVLDCVLTDGYITMDESNDFYLKLPSNYDFLKANLEKVDKNKIKDIESK